MARSSTAQFDGSAHAPAQARRFAMATVQNDASPDQASDIAMVVSELVTNAVRAGATSVEVCLTVQEAAVRIEVSDAADGWPVQRAAQPFDESGRGLLLVDAIASRWGVDPQHPRGKRVWATLDLQAVG